MITTDIEEKNLDRLMLKISVICLFVYIILTHVIRPTVVSGVSMMPTVENADYALIDLVTPTISGYERFDIIVFEKDEKVNYIKRIIGVEGDEITYVNDTLYINGIKYDEPYLDEYKSELLEGTSLTEDFNTEEYLGKRLVPKGHVFVSGDNRIRSLDSRQSEVGFIPIDSIIGKAKLVFRNSEGVKVINK